MEDAAKLKPIGSVFCKQYNCEVSFYADEANGQLIARYAAGYTGRDDLEIVDGRAQFATAIPVSWTEDELHRLLMEPMNPLAPYDRRHLGHDVCTAVSGLCSVPIAAR